MSGPGRYHLLLTMDGRPVQHGWWNREETARDKFRRWIGERGGRPGTASPSSMRRPVLCWPTGPTRSPGTVRGVTRRPLCPPVLGPYGHLHGPFSFYRLHVITDATTGQELYRHQAVKTGTGNTQYSG
ncbi:hypothetical protein AB0F45_35715, partial [Streptomyces achromogenes]|uniref:hypothetical protein n=1 Tax=Streptomyces achromogenes TaxID=67255 RepID=UPI0033D33B83